jgi:hypothetical protein
VGFVLKEVDIMIDWPQHWTLDFDGNEFALESCSEPGPGLARNRVLEESLETLLFYWGDRLLPAPPLLMLAYSEPIVREQDLLALDGLGRIHIFELKKDKADSGSLFQLISYLAGRPRDDMDWIRRTLARTLWHGEQAQACRLAGLVARQRVENLRTDKSRKAAGRRVPHTEMLEAKLDALAKLASERGGLDMNTGTFRNIARPLLERRYGGSWEGPLETPGSLLEPITEAKLSSHWQLGRTEPGVVIWTIAPNIEEAQRAAEPLIERNLEIRCVSVDAREVEPGRVWSITVNPPKDRVREWRTQDLFSYLMGLVMAKHLDQCPSAGDRLFLQLHTKRRLEGNEIAWLGWHAAGGTYLILRDYPDRIESYLYNHWWTEGQTFKMRGPILALCKDLRRAHPKSWSWCPEEPDATCNSEFVEAAAQLLTDYWQGLEELGAFEVDRWAYWKPPE